MKGRCSVQRGIALMLVLWVLALLTIIAVGLTTAQRTESTLTGNQLASARFHALAEAGVSWAILNLLAPVTIIDEETEVWVPDGMPRSWTFAGETLQIRVFNETSRVDLNTADRDLLEALLRAAAPGGEEAEEKVSTLADAIEDWRDTDDLTELNGAEDREYAAAGRSYGAKDGPFDSVDELQLVLGVDRDLYRTLLPALTVNAGGAELNQRYSPPLVQAALEALGRKVPAGAGDSDGNAVDRGGPLYRMRVTHLVDTHLVDNGPGLTMETLIRIEKGRSPPFRVLWRRFGLVAEQSVASADAEDGEDGLF
ncbi:general secretion pathway protein GspK [Candidatus Thiosymbion oneisti]|uniref:general secretion pathway protein GspK n=1 Tax=Candidatus Thiosymbion oneisti TaxID=589554 RepID=UPI000B7FCD9F|nr:type II secretion system protein GspK [Candidatus Thiosymbion oneisti]